MVKKRKHDQRRDESSSSDAKRHRSCRCQNGDSSDGMPREGSLRDAVIELKDFIQVKVSTEEKFKRKIEKLKKKQKEFKEYIRILTEEVSSLKESHEELKTKFQETQKEGCAEVNQYDGSPSQRSQLSQSIKFRLVIENELRKTIYKRERVETVDGGGRIKVVMYDGVNQIASDHPLASVRVDLVVIEGWFNECKPTQDSWSKEDFEKSIIQPRKGITRVVKNGTFNLIGGSCAHEGAIIMDNSQQREVKLGVMIAMHTEERVLEGVSNPFKVQEARTKSSKKKGQKHSSPVPTGNLVQPTNIHETQHGHSLVSRGEQHSLPPLAIQGLLHTEGHSLVRPGEQHSLPPPAIQGLLHTEGHSLVRPGEQHSLPPPAIQGLLQTEDNGKHKQFLTEDNRPSYPPATMPLIAAPVEGNGQDYSLPPHTQHALQAAGNSTTYQLPHYYGECSSTSYDNASSELDLILSEYVLNGLQTGQWNSTPEGENIEDVHHLNAQKQNQEAFGSFTCGQALLLWDKPDVELKQRFNFLDQLIPPLSTHWESFPSTSLIYKAHKLLASVTRTPSHRRGVLIQPIEPDDEPTVKKQRHAKYELRFVNRVCNDYYTREQIKSDDGNFLKVALYDENNLVVTSGPLSSASVKVVLLHGDFNAEGQNNWTSEEFSTFLVCPQSVKEPPALGGDRVLVLIDGEADLGNINFQNSSFHARTGKFKMGVEIKNVREERVQEGITGSFLVRARQGEGGFSKKSNVGCGGYGEVYKEINNTMGNKLQLTSAMTMKLPYELLEEITNDFAEDRLVGSGGYGMVYKGILKTGVPIAVKKISQNLGLDNDKQFENECAHLMQIRHKNIVRFIGYATAMSKETALCFEYLPRGNIHKHLSDEFSGCDWSTRYSIIRGICEGLEYLHSKDIYHLDLKPSNILLEDHMVPKISDFGLSRLFIDSIHPTRSLTITTPGYMPPEYIDKRKISNKFDVFSLGIIIIQIMAGQMGYSKISETSSQEFIGNVHENWRKRLQTTMRPHASEQLQQVQTCIKLALKCAEANWVKRPTTTEIVDELNKIDTANSSSGPSYISTLEKQDELCGQQHGKMETQGVSDSEEELSEEALLPAPGPYATAIDPPSPPALRPAASPHLRQQPSGNAHWKAEGSTSRAALRGAMEFTAASSSSRLSKEGDEEGEEMEEEEEGEEASPREIPFMTAMTAPASSSSPTSAASPSAAAASASASGSGSPFRSSDGAGASGSGAGGGDVEVIDKEHMFDKVVTLSDVGTRNVLVIPKQHAEKYFPLDAAANEKGRLLSFEDRGGKLWRFHYTYWNISQSYVMGWSNFVKEKRLDAGDTVSFCRGAAEATRDRLFIDWKRGAELRDPHRLALLPMLMPPAPPATLYEHHRLRQSFVNSPTASAERVRLFGVNLDNPHTHDAV